MDTLMWLHILIFTIIAGIQFGRFPANVFHPNLLYIMFHLVVFVIRPAAVSIFDFQNIFRAMGFRPTPQEADLTLIVSDIGLVCFCLSGWLVSWNRSKVAFNPDPVFSETPVGQQERKAFNYALIILLPPALLSLIYTAAHPLQTIQVGGGQASGMHQAIDPATGRRIFESGSAYILDAQYLAGTLAVAFAYLNRFRLFSLAPFLIYFAIRASAGQARFSFVLLSLEFLLVYLLFKQRVTLPIRAIAAAALIFALFSSLGTDREVIRRAVGLHTDTEVSTPKAVKTVEDFSIFGPDFANYDYLSYIISNVPERSGTFSYFTQYADVIVHPIPRALWPGKPAGSWLNPVDLNEFGNFAVFTPSLVGDGWISLGFVGVATTLSIVGWLGGTLYRRFAASAGRSTFGSLAYCAFLSLMPQWFRDGGVSIAEFTGFTILPIIVWWLIYRQLDRTRSPGRALRRSGASLPLTARRNRNSFIVPKRPLTRPISPVKSQD